MCYKWYVFCFKINIGLSVKTTDIVSGGVWGHRPHTFSKSTLLMSRPYVTVTQAYNKEVTGWRDIGNHHMQRTDENTILYGYPSIDIKFWLKRSNLGSKKFSCSYASG